jgi:hypothetical protein
MSWITNTETQDCERVPQLFSEWMDYYDANGIKVIESISVHLRRRSSGRNWVYIDSDHVHVNGLCSTEVMARFAALDFLNQLPGERALLAQPLVLDPHVRVIQEHVVTDEGPRLAANRLEYRGGLRYSADLDANVMRMLMGCASEQPLGVVLEELAGRLGLDVSRVQQSALPVARHLIERGFLTPTRGAK